MHSSRVKLSVSRLTWSSNMPHVTFVPLTGFRLREEALLALGMSLPGLAPRAQAIGQLPALGLLTLAGMLPEDWTCDYQPSTSCDVELIERIAEQRPALVAISALTASIEEAYGLCDRLRERGVRTVLGGLHVTACPDEAAAHADAVVVGSAEAGLARRAGGRSSRQCCGRCTRAAGV